MNTKAKPQQIIDIDEELTAKEEWLENRLAEDSFPYYVSIEQSYKDYNATLKQDEQRYKNKHKKK